MRGAPNAPRGVAQAPGSFGHGVLGHATNTHSSRASLLQ